jgi:dienelactone hydrolase
MASALRTLAGKCLSVAALSWLALARPSPASAEELVKFASAARRLYQAGEPALRNKSDIQGYLTRPRGDGPFPAVALLHSCLGLPVDRRSIAGALASWGYVALFVDDFTSRGIKETCAVDFAEGVPDAFGALAFLSTLRYVDPARIGAVGYSQGADSALTIASSRFASAFAIPVDRKFKVAAAFYPPCENQASVRMAIPTLILIGALDDVTAAADCARLASDSSEVELVVYPGAYHGFDNPDFADGKRLLGMTLKYDRNAEEQSRAALRDFLATKLAK